MGGGDITMAKQTIRFAHLGGSLKPIFVGVNKPTTYFRIIGGAELHIKSEFVANFATRAVSLNWEIQDERSRTAPNEAKLKTLMQELNGCKSVIELEFGKGFKIILDWLVSENAPKKPLLIAEPLDNSRPASGLTIVGIATIPELYAIVKKNNIASFKKVGDESHMFHILSIPTGKMTFYWELFGDRAVRTHINSEGRVVKVEVFTLEKSGLPQTEPIKKP
jgi:hypothetical protein